MSNLFASASVAASLVCLGAATALAWPWKGECERAAERVCEGHTHCVEYAWKRCQPNEKCDGSGGLAKLITGADKPGWPGVGWKQDGCAREVSRYSTSAEMDECVERHTIACRMGGR
jgi:hypothetical protein